MIFIKRKQKSRGSQMADAGEILVVIPARGGSKRLSRKNVLPLAGKPLICWTIEAAIDAKLNARILVSSDDDEILSIATQYQVDGVIAYKRPEKLASDTASTIDVVKDACLFMLATGFQPETIILLQPTSPLRNSDDIQGAINLYYQNNNKDTVVSVCEVEHPSAWTGTLAENYRINGIDFSGKRSQEYAQEYRLNGAIYVADYNYLESAGTLFTDSVCAYVMPKDRSVDIDDNFGFNLARLCIEMTWGQVCEV